MIFLFSAVFAGTQALIAPASDTTSDELPGTVSFSIYAQISGIDGESMDADHKDWIDILSFDYSMHQPTTGTGATRRRSDVVIEDIVLTKYVDKATPKLMEACAKGTNLPEVMIDIVRVNRDSPESFYTYELKNCIVTSYSSQGSVLEDPYPWDTFTISFEEITVTYTEYDSTGHTMGDIEWSYSLE